nr:helix-turn-helix transcriptional regulator [Eggerthella lenta]
MTRATRILLGQRVRALREESNLTQEQLALMTGVGRSYLARWRRATATPPSTSWRRSRSAWA